jgi:hypothetical protein
MIVCGLRAGHTMKEIKSYGNINKSTVFYDVERKFEKFIASGGSADKVLTGRKRTVLAASLDKLITMQGWLKENLTEVWVEEVWLPSLPDCNPFDYFVCGVSE